MTRRQLRRTRRTRQAGFTLIELAIALVAGLIVAIGMVTLSKEATRTFHEEVRNAAAEASVRTAIDRLTTDLQRAGHMSTGNIVLDPMLVHDVGGGVLANIAFIHKATWLGLLSLASIRYSSPNDATNPPVAGGSLANAPLSAAQPDGLSPDLIDIAGNMTTADQFDVQMIVPAGQAAPGFTVVPGCQQILISNTSGAAYRISQGDPSTSTTGNAAMRNAFQPVPATMTTQFIVRIVDNTGHSQFVTTCPLTSAAGILAGQPYLWIDSLPGDAPLVPAAPGRIGGLTGSGSGAVLNPVQIVRWEITSAGATNDPEPAQYAAGLGGSVDGGAALDPNKYDLMRSFVGLDGAIIKETSEIIAEYAIDFKVAFSVDTGASQTQPTIVSYALDDAAHNTTYASLLNTPGQGPQRIRSVRARIATRTALADRSLNIKPLPANYLGQQFMYRYCMATNCSGNTLLQWARTRTVTTEVSLPNQSRNYY